MNTLIIKFVWTKYVKVYESNWKGTESLMKWWLNKFLKWKGAIKLIKINLLFYFKYDIFWNTKSKSNVFVLFLLLLIIFTILLTHSHYLTVLFMSFVCLSKWKVTANYFEAPPKTGGTYDQIFEESNLIHSLKLNKWPSNDSCELCLTFHERSKV